MNEEIIEDELEGLIELLIERVIAIANNIPPPDDKAAELMMAATTARSFLHRILAKHHSRSAYNPNERVRQALERVAELEAAAEQARDLLRKDASSARIQKLELEVARRGMALAGAVTVLIRYRNETPLGHQPHMIAHVADQAIADAESALSPLPQGED